MAGTTWAALANNELVCHDEVVNAVATGNLMWAGGNPGLAGGYCYTRSDFASYILHNATTLAASGIAANELMSKSEMVAHRTLNFALITSTESQWVSLGLSWRGRVTFSVGAGTNSVQIQVATNGGSFSLHQNLNVTPGSTGIVSNWKDGIAPGDFIEFRIYPYTGSSQSGTQGTGVISNQLFEP